MRIDAYNQISSMYQTNQKAKTQATTKATPKDAVYISNSGKEYQSVRTAVSAASDIREDKVTDLKNKIASGTYQVSADSFAEKLIAKYHETL